MEIHHLLKIQRPIKMQNAKKSKKGDLETVRRLLSSKKIDINIQNILIQKHS